MFERFVTICFLVTITACGAQEHRTECQRAWQARRNLSAALHHLHAMRATTFQARRLLDVRRCLRPKEEWCGAGSECSALVSGATHVYMRHLCAEVHKVDVNSSWVIANQLRSLLYASHDDLVMRSNQ